MALKADSSHLMGIFDSIDAFSIQQKRSLKSPIYQYSRPPNDDEPKLNGKGHKIIYCFKCLYGALATINLWNYLKLKHQIILAVSNNNTKIATYKKLK